MSRKKKVLVIVGVVVLVIVLGVSSMVRRMNRFTENLEALSYSDVDLSELADGEYIGECDLDVVKARVSVIISEGAIIGLDILEHRHGRGSAAESIIDDVLAEQRVTVDTISGATASSRVILKAVENALLGVES